MPTNQTTKNTSPPAGTHTGGSPQPGAGAAGVDAMRDTSYGNTPSQGDARSAKGGAAGTTQGGDGQSGRGLLDGLQQQVKSTADQQKNRAAEGLGGIAQVFRNAGNEMRSENETIASYVDMAGDRLREWADTVRERGVEEMLDDVQDYARRRPAVFIGGALLVGLGLARFLKSSSEQRMSSTRMRTPRSGGTGMPTYAAGEPFDEGASGLGSEYGRY